MTSVNSDEVLVLATVFIKEKSAVPIIVAVQQSNLIATAFHPELTEDLLWHKYFLNQIVNQNLK